MANHPSAEKRNRQRLKRTARNRAHRSELRSTLKTARLALAGDDTAEAATLVAQAQQALARAASKGLIHRNTAARGKSRLAKALVKAS